MKKIFPPIDCVREGPHRSKETSSRGFKTVEVFPSKGLRAWRPSTQSSHFPRRSLSKIFRPSTRLSFVICRIVKGLQCVRRRCHCSREVGCDKDENAYEVCNMPGK